MIIDCISDLHGYYPTLKGGDLLIVAGDLTAKDEPGQYFKFFHWIATANYKKKILIAGNHDNLIQNETIPISCIADFEYLCDSGTEFEGSKIWGSPWTKTFPGMNRKCKAFTKNSDKALSEKWNLIPNDIDILITHCPPYSIMDGVTIEDGSEFHTGSIDLKNQIIDRIHPKLHVFGHIHEHGGKMIDSIPTKFVNVSHVNEYYIPRNNIIRIIL